MAQIPHRREIVERLKEYPQDHAEFLELTRKEFYNLERLTQLPTDSVTSARLDGMPQARVSMVSDPTIRIVLTREAIQERVAANAAALTEKITTLADRLAQFWDWWTTLTDTRRAFVDVRYWHGASYQEVVRFFRAESDRFFGYIPDTEDKVMRFEDELLSGVEHLWYAAPPAIPGKSRVKPR